MDKDPKALEEKAYQALSQEKFEDSFKFFKSAADIYKSEGRHKQSALCFAAAAGSWMRKCGERPFYNAALTYEEAARQSEISKDFEYASLLYKYAAISYEKDGEFLNFSDSFYRCRDSHRRFLTYLLLSPKKINNIVGKKAEKGIRAKLRYLFIWIFYTLSYLIWGYGERPLRAFFSAIAVVFLAAIFYTRAGLLMGTDMIYPNFFEAFYFSTITFTTVGYGDITAAGLSKIAVVIEAFSGVFLMPLFIVSLSRKYLRV